MADTIELWSQAEIRCRQCGHTDTLQGFGSEYIRGSSVGPVGDRAKIVCPICKTSVVVSMGTLEALSLSEIKEVT